MKVNTVAQLIAAEYHGGALNKHDGTLYLLHPIRVAAGAGERAKHWGLKRPVVEAVGYLHDAVEDTDLTFAILRERLLDAGIKPGVVELVVGGVEGMTKRQGESLTDYYLRCRLNAYSRCVKLDGDIRDNFRRNHLIADPEKVAKFAKKYSLGIDILS